jgi:7-carboxy-7-deazaguanine synthase
MAVEDVIEEVRTHGIPLVELTGGEPLLQAEAPLLMERLVGEGFSVLLETGGHRPIDDVPDEVIVILDVKCPGSGEAEAMHWPNLEQLALSDEVKFVVADRGDFDYAVDVTVRHRLSDRVGAVLFSPAFGVLEPSRLAAWLLEAVSGAHASTLRKTRLQLQTHKYIWDPAARGV